ncbi:MAG: DUF3048 domain-containing protein [Lachnospiraceae bacterium]|nr:DUF3048 domain-containing protein [Lachnospiraceae bacterium]
MKKNVKALAAILLASTFLFACGSGDTPADSGIVAVDEIAEVISTPEPTVNVEPTPEPTPDRTGLYKSELTGEWIDEGLKSQRPVAIMVDNEISTYPHYGINQADIVYEMMNSTANDRVTRFMCIVKDYEKIERFGGVRSIRPTNFLVGFPYEAIFCHDGGPFYINDYVAKSYCDHFSGIFARFTRASSEHPSWATSQAGKTYASEFTEFVTYEDYKNPNTGKSYSGLKSALEKAAFSKDYSADYQGTGLNFLDDGESDLSENTAASAGTDISLPFKHTQTALKYNSATGTYDLYEYGNVHTDAADNNNVTTFKNVLLLSCGFSELDSHGYMIYNYYNWPSDKGKADGYYLTNGKSIPIKWTKSGSDSEPAHYYDANTDEEIVLNPGKVYISLVPSDSWSSVSIK